MKNVNKLVRGYLIAHISVSYLLAIFILKFHFTNDVEMPIGKLCIRAGGKQMGYGWGIARQFGANR